MGVGSGLGVAVGIRVGLAVGVAVAVGEGLAVGDGVGVGCGVSVGARVGVAAKVKVSVGGGTTSLPCEAQAAKRTTAARAIQMFRLAITRYTSSPANAPARLRLHGSLRDN